MLDDQTSVYIKSDHTKSTQPHFITVLQHRPFNSQDHLTSRVNTKCKSAIHVTIRSVISAEDNPTNEKNDQHETISQHTIDRPKTAAASINVSKISRHHSHSLSQDTKESTDLQDNSNIPSLSFKNKNTNNKSDHQVISQSKQRSSSPLNKFHNKRVFTRSYNQIKQINIWSSQICMMNDHHQQLKKNKTTKCRRKTTLISSISIALILGLILTIVLVIILNKPKITKTKISLLRWNSTGITVAGVTGLGGIASNQLHVPWDIALDWSNTLYIVDRLNNRVQKYLRDVSNGTTIAGQVAGSSGSTLNDLKNPANIIIDESGTIYISDESNQRIVYWTKDASSGSILTGITGVIGNANNQLNNPQGLARDANSGVIYVADYLNQRIMSYRPGISSGTLVAGGNGPGINDTQLWGPVSVHFDSFTNSLFIANFASNNIVRWILGDSIWTHIAGSIDSSSGNTSTSFWEPSDITLDPMGNIYVVDRHNHRVQFFSNQQSNGITIAGITSISGSNASLLANPTSLTLDNQLNLYVVDCLNHRIQKFIRY